MGQETTFKISSDGLSVAAALAASTSGLRQTVLALAATHGGRSGPWLDQLEAAIVRDTKNMVFNGASMEAEAAAVEYALANLKATFAHVRQILR